MDYKRLADMGWKQNRIAQAKRVSESQVSKRLQCANFPDLIIEIFQSERLAEYHAFHLLSLKTLKDFSIWLRAEVAMSEICGAAIKRGATANDFKKLVEEYNGRHIPAHLGLTVHFKI